MRTGWSKLLVKILEKISNLLEELDNYNFNWRCRYLNSLLKAMIDGFAGQAAIGMPPSPERILGDGVQMLLQGLLARDATPGDP